MDENRKQECILELIEVIDKHFPEALVMGDDDLYDALDGDLGDLIERYCKED